MKGWNFASPTARFRGGRLDRLRFGVFPHTGTSLARDHVFQSATLLLAFYERWIPTLISDAALCIFTTSGYPNQGADITAVRAGRIIKKPTRVPVVVEYKSF